MRKIAFIFATLLLAALSCSKMENPDPASGDDLRLHVGIPDTKVALGPESAGVYKMFWSEGDRISVNGVVSEPLTAAQAGQSSADFTIKAYKEPESDIIYPAGAVVDGKVSLPCQQAYVAGGVDPELALLSGHSTGSSVTLKHACAYVKVTVSKKADETLKTVKLFTSDSTPLSGEFKIDCASAALTATSETRGYVMVASESGIPYTDGKVSVVFAVPSGNYPKGFAVSASALDGAQMAAKSYESGTKLEAGSLYDMPAVQFEDDGVLFSGGTGTDADPYRIITAGDLKALSEMSNGGEYASVCSASFVQEADINMSYTSGYAPICNDSSKPFTGKYDGKGHLVDGLAASGLFGYCNGCSIVNVSVSAIMDGKDSDAGAIARKVLSGTFSGLTAKGIVKGRSNVGGIIGNISASSNVTVSDCRCYAVVEGADCYVGGIAGYIDSAARVLVDRCSAYGNVKGLYAVGGITGFSYIPDASPATSRIAHTNCLYSGMNLELTGNNGANGYGMLGGIIGWMRTNQDSAATQNILCCASYVYRMTYVGTYGTYSTIYPCVGGIVGLQDKTPGTGLIGGCFSSFQLSRLWCDGDTKARVINNGTTEGLNYGGIYGRCSTAMHYQSCYYDNTIKMGPSASSVTSKVSCDYSGPYSNLMSKLNSFVSSYTGEYSLGTWTRDSRGCVVPAGTTTEGTAPMIRISVIGDSISTFRSWIPIGYAVYYYDNMIASGLTDPTDVTWDLTYWGRLANDYIKNGVVEKNIAWSGSCVTNCDSQTSKPGFTTRMASSGIGAPDVVLIHGGTNDWNRNQNGTKVDNANGYAYNVKVPASVMNGLYEKDVNALNPIYYADAYVKLVKQIHAEHPDAKIVFVTGDRQDLAMVDVMKQVAEHYKDFARLVDLRTMGYNNLPKYSGSHPTAAGHGKMADMIYAQTGSWIEGN